MKIFSSLIVLMFVGAALAETVPPRAESIARVSKGCLASKKVAPAVCSCITANFEKKLDDAELKLLADEYDSAEPGPDEGTSSALATFDLEVAENCIKNPKWRTKDTDLKD